MSSAARNTNALCLPVSLRHKLQCAGLRTTHHLQGLSSAQLADGELAFPVTSMAMTVWPSSHAPARWVCQYCTQLHSAELMQKAQGFCTAGRATIHCAEPVSSLCQALHQSSKIWHHASRTVRCTQRHTVHGQADADGLSLQSA